MFEDVQLLKSLHIFGATLFLGNILVTAVWKIAADRTRRPEVIAYAQRMVSVTDYVFTVLGAAILVLTGNFLAVRFGPILDVYWLRWGVGLLLASATLWILVLIPVQVMQSRLAEEFESGGEIPARYWALGRIWSVFGIVAVLLPLGNLYFMVFKPLA